MTKVVKYISIIKKTRFDMEVEALETLLRKHLEAEAGRQLSDVAFEWDSSGAGLVRGISITITEREEKVE